MKKILLLLALAVCSGVVQLRAQTTLQTPSPYGYTYGYSTSGQNVGVMFMVTNNNSVPIYITKVGYANYVGGGTHEIWHSTSSLTGFGNVSASSGWVLDATRAAGGSTYSSTIDDNYWQNICLMVPANTTYRFAAIASSTSSAAYGISLGLTSTYTNTSNGVTIDNNSYWGNYNNLSATGYTFMGSITFTMCAPLSGATAANIKSKSADLSWGASSGGTGYEYSLTTTPTPGTPTATTGTSFSATGLTPATTYYLNVRKVCSSSDKSCWAMTSFTTLPPCTVPANFTLTSLSPTAADFTWDPVVTAINYNYVVDQQTSTPVTTGATTTLTNTGSATGLTEGTKYYVHIRTNCDGEQTDWSLDSFTTPIPCRSPVVRTDYLNTDQAVAFWDAIPTATAYEYAVTKSSTPPALGTKLEAKSILLSALLDGVTYYIHVRSQCMSQGIEGLSPWATTSFKTFPLAVNTINNEGLSLEVYPNPAQNVLNIKMLGTLQHNAIVNLTDISGRILKQMTLDQNEMTMDISGFAPGIYQLQYKDDVNSKVIKVVKQ